MVDEIYGVALASAMIDGCRRKGMDELALVFACCEEVYLTRGGSITGVGPRPSIGRPAIWMSRQR